MATAAQSLVADSKLGSKTEGNLPREPKKQVEQLSGDPRIDAGGSSLTSKPGSDERSVDDDTKGGKSGDMETRAAIGGTSGSNGDGESSEAPCQPKRPLSSFRAQSPTAALKAYEGTSPNTRQLIGRKRGRERRGALLPNTMTAKLVEQAAERHRIKRKAEDEGRDVDEEELDLCGISEQMKSVGSRKPRVTLDDGVDGVLEEDDIVFSKRQRRLS